MDRARFLESMDIGPKCFVHGLQRGKTDGLVSMFQRGHSQANFPLLNAEPITDDDPEVVALEKARWR